MNWNNIDTVFLDMDGTLIDLRFDNFFWNQHLPKRYAEFHGLSPALSFERLAQYNRSIRGTLNWYCLDHWDAWLGMETAPLKHELTELIRYRPHAERFLKALSESSLNVAIITNSHPRSFEIKDSKLNLSRYLDFVVSSHEYGYPKEDHRFWQALQSRHHFNPENTLFIDDNITVLEAAKTFGIEHLLAVTHPDSSTTPQKIEGFKALHHFSELLPIIKSRNVQLMEKEI